ncbi:MAG: aldehyde dehydrogenase family protein [Pseudomonadota bacterium]|nr:aldehyde dehydrogenase family protein [Pseudomonadota bacterium]
MNQAVNIPEFADLSPSVREFIARTQKLYIDGQWVDAASGATFDTIDPATEHVICSVAEAGVVDVDRAAQAAHRAFYNGPWASMIPAAREALMLKWADLVEAHADEIAELESLDNGKLVFYAKIIDVPAAVQLIRYYAGYATKIEGSTVTPSIGIPGLEFHAYTLRQPIGVVGQIIPWNFPLIMAALKLAPALACGCTSVLKPAEQTPLSAIRLVELAEQAGFPPGVINLVQGRGDITGQALIEHPLVRKIAFTGSTPVGRHIGKVAMDSLKRVSLELGGKSPVIITKDANLAEAIPGAANAIFFNQGQVCVAGTRLFVEDAVYDEVISGMTEIAKNMQLGGGRSPNVQMGPLVSKEQHERVLGYIEKGISEGGELLCGGTRHGERGYFVQPTIFGNCGPQSTLYREEIFGPVLVANKFKSEDDIVAMANDTIYGLAASVWTQDLGTAHRLAKRIEAGTVWVNCHHLIDPALPFGGFKQSGLGREQGADGIELYTERKSVLVKL